MTIVRSQQIDLQATPYYHCISRVVFVRHAFLCGDDQHGGQNFDHHKQWIVDRINLLEKIFTINIIAAYIIMSNHYHLVLHIDSTQTNEFSNMLLSYITKTNL